MKDELGGSKRAPEELESQEAPVIVPIEDSIDLHTFRPREVKDLVPDYLEAAWEKGFTEVRIIHGKGTGILREAVHSILRKHPLVASFCQADAGRGGWGATVVLLKGKRDGERITHGQR